MSHISRGTRQPDREDLNTVMAYCGISMGADELEEIFRRHEDGGHVLCEDLSRSLRPPLTHRQHEAVVSLFESLEDPTFRTGAIELEELLGRYRAARHPKVVSGEMEEEEEQEQEQQQEQEQEQEKQEEQEDVEEQEEVHDSIPGILKMRWRRLEELSWSRTFSSITLMWWLDTNLTTRSSWNFFEPRGDSTFNDRN
ncbi:hypothetical protein GUITHDRAFT_121944 [Guillardia theta CCMP2712]|uniref:EF-hand domain-containing protein n=1 Tax=Guillardia theta (strain CCMP2712) TaxID=905079 RepID=L1I6L5_GUITC|nr:hypothetical protein GUITHDRAFT_121944 [Guillardia theta CCMP2712]EKX31871.1 hypothetical protein GUITHDRAFT_121944 [Guillardia theta CCMP2712]|eukprot:XP_005818851.1 hypothetical protein GUITHDRAFT_121944 [Guillardia theta CCMP2712]